MPHNTEISVLPTESFDAIFRAESLEERVEFQQCEIYMENCEDPNFPTDPNNPPTTVTPEPATLLMSAVGLGSVGVATYLRRRSSKRQNDATNESAKQD